MTTRSGPIRIAAAALLALTVASGAASAAKTLDPQTADALVAEARKAGMDGFCTKPPHPLRGGSRDLCPLAREVKGCEALVTECELEAKPIEPPTWSFGGLGPILSAIANALVWILVAAAVGVVIALIVGAIARAQRDRQAAEKPAKRRAQVVPDAAVEALETTTEAEALLRQAAEHAQRGELDRATSLYLAASLRALDRRGAIRIARHRTNGEYVRSCKETETKPELRAIVREVDRVQFGRESATHERLADVAMRATAIVARAGATALLVLATLVALGACALPERLAASDPAEDDLLVELLKREGATVSRLTSSLATLPIPGTPAAKEPAPLLIVDASRVPLEEEARAHLARWVEAGGRLVLAGDVRSWPESFKVKSAPTKTTALSVLLAPDGGEDEDDGDEDQNDHPIENVYKTYPAKVANAAALEWPKAYVLASTDTHEVYAAARAVEKGLVVGFAGDDLFTNAGLARSPNAAALVAILNVYVGARTIAIARPEDGISPPSNPVSALTHAGLGLGLAHAAVATLILMLAFGIRQARAKLAPPERRRAWTEHIEATGGLYARAKLAPHALAAYTRFVDGRLRERMPRGMSDPSTFLALRANADPAWTADVWRRATAARSADRPDGDELVTLRRLSALYAAAVKSE